MTMDNPEDLIFVYANSVMFIKGEWDLRLVFKDTHLNTQTNVTVYEPRIGITLSWEQAKVVLLFLQTNIDLREEERGEILIPTESLIDAVREKIGTQDYVTMKTAQRAIRETLEEAKKIKTI